MSEGKPPQEQTTETERNREEVEEGATDENAGEGGAEEILDDPSHNPDDPNLEKYRGG